jgi:hypothetical protein
MEIKRRFSLPGNDYDYVVISMEGDDPVRLLTKIHEVFFDTIAFQAYIQGNDYDLENRIERVYNAADIVRDRVNIEVIEDDQPPF